MTNKKKTLIIALGVILLTGLSLVIALRLKKIGEAPVAPKPKATEDVNTDIFASITPASGCHVDMSTQTSVCVEPPETTLDIKSQDSSTMPIISWTCNPLENNLTCYVIKKYVYNPAESTSNGCISRTCGAVPSTAALTTLIISSSDVKRIGNTCYYNDRPTQEQANMCVGYKVEAKNITANSTCEACTENNDTTCCLKETPEKTLCGVSKNPVASLTDLHVEESGTVLTWKDSSAFENGYKIYSRVPGTVETGFQVSPEDVLRGTVLSSEAVNGVYRWTIPTTPSDLRGMVFSVVAYANFCTGCPGSPTQTPTSTPRVTATPTSPAATSTPTVPAATSTPLPTSTPAPLGESYCDYITANPTNGQKTLTVNFTGKGFDTIRIKGYRFTFGDGQNKEFIGTYTSDHIQSTQHDYATTGKYLAQLEILDDGDHWRTRNECKVEITVTSPAAGPTSPPGVPATSTPRPTATTALVAQGPTTAEPIPTEVRLPEAGIKIPALGGLIGGFLLLAIGLAIIF